MKRESDILQRVRGVLVAFLLNMVAVLGFSIVFPLLIPAIGIVQIIYIIPYIHTLKKYGEFATIKGVVIGALIVALINLCGWLALLLFYR